MPTAVQLTVTTAVTEANPECVLGGRHEESTIAIDLDARRKDHHRILGFDRGVEIHWPKETRQHGAQELSTFP